MLTNFSFAPKEKYDHIISLGYNCEVTFRFLKYFQFEESNLFNWCYIRSINDLIFALKNMDKLGISFANPNPLYECKNTHIRFHGKADMSLFMQNSIDLNLVENDKKDLLERIEYLKVKFEKISRDTSSKLFIYKIDKKDIDENVYLKIEELYNTLCLLGAQNFKLLVVSEERYRFDKVYENIFFKTVKYFAPDDNVTNSKFKNNGWENIYKNYEITKIKSKKQKKYKFEKVSQVVNTQNSLLLNNGEQPLVSVIIPAYNHENYVQDTINSIINQSYQNIELLVIDDGSKDSTWAKITELESKCRERFSNIYFKTKSNEGVCVTLKQLIDLAKGEYIYIIASDDLAKPEAIEKEVEFLHNNQEYGLVVGNNEIIDSQGKQCYWTKSCEITYDLACAKFETFGHRLKRRRNDVDFASDDFGSYSSLKRGNYIPNGYLIRSSLLKEIQDFPEGEFLEDYFIMLQLSKFTRFKYLDTVLFSYRWHETNTIKNSEKMRRYNNNTKNLDTQILKSLLKTEKKNRLLPEVFSFIKFGCKYKTKKMFMFTKEYYQKFDSTDYRVIKFKNLVLFSYKRK